MSADARFAFPAETFASAESFHEFCRENRTLLDTRFEYESSLPDPRLAQFCAAGSCQLCLCATSFTTPLPGDGMPNWREGQHCACPDRLNARFRAMLGFVAAPINPPPWTRALLLGAAHAMEPRLQRMVASVSARARSGRLLRQPRFEPHSYQLILSCDHLQEEPSCDAVLAGLRAAMAPGGTLLLTAPFDANAEKSRPRSEAAPGVLGWDILDRLTEAGFVSAAAHLYWSEEFGLLGAYNMLFSAAA